MSIEYLTHDRNGFPIEVADLLKVFHFIGPRRKRNYMYKVVRRVGDKLYAFSSHELAEGKADPHKCLLCTGCFNREDVEIVEGYGENGGKCFTDRQRTK